MAKLNQSALKALDKKMKWSSNKTIGSEMAGEAIKTLVKTYKIPMKTYGISGSHIGIETKKQKIFWLDKGTELEFKGILDKSSDGKSTLSDKTYPATLKIKKSSKLSDRTPRQILQNEPSTNKVATLDDHGGASGFAMLGVVFIGIVTFMGADYLLNRNTPQPAVSDCLGCNAAPRLQDI